VVRVCVGGGAGACVCLYVCVVWGCVCGGLGGVGGGEGGCVGGGGERAVCVCACVSGGGERALPWPLPPRIQVNGCKNNFSPRGGMSEGQDDLGCRKRMTYVLRVDDPRFQTPLVTVQLLPVTWFPQVGRRKIAWWDNQLAGV